MPSALDIAHRIVISNLRENPPNSNRGPIIDRMLKSAGTNVGAVVCRLRLLVFSSSLWQDYQVQQRVFTSHSALVRGPRVAQL